MPGVCDRRQFIKAAAAIVGGIVCETVSGVEPKPVMRESRVILDEGLHWVTVDSATRLCERVKRAGFNVIIPCVWHGRGTSWASDIAPWDDRLDSRLHHKSIENLLRVAKTYQLEVHPWFTVGLRQRKFLDDFAMRPKSRAFDFNNYEFRDFIVSLVLEFVGRYPVDGINLDFVRFSAPRPGREVKQERAVVDVVRRISDGVRSVDKAIVISVDAAPYLPRMKQFGQDSVKWADQGLLMLFTQCSTSRCRIFKLSRR